MDPVISVIIPTYNRKHLVIEAISSVLQQDPKNYEIIVVDDGSTDNTVSYLQSLNLPIEIVETLHGGIASARNRGIQKAKGTFIAFLDSDDLFLPGCLFEQVHFLQKHPAIPLVYTDQYIEFEGKIQHKTRFAHGRPGPKDDLPGFVGKIPIHPSAVMVRISIFDEVGYFNETLEIHEDTDLWNRISEKYDLGYIEEALSIFRWEKDPEHILHAKYRRLFISEGRKYMKLYEEQKKHRALTKQENAGIKESYKRIDALEKLIDLREKDEITEEEYNEKKENLFH